MYSLPRLAVAEIRQQRCVGGSLKQGVNALMMSIMNGKGLNDQSRDIKYIARTIPTMIRTKVSSNISKINTPRELCPGGIYFLDSELNYIVADQRTFYQKVSGAEYPRSNDDIEQAGHRHMVFDIGTGWISSGYPGIAFNPRAEHDAKRYGYNHAWSVTGTRENK